MKKKVFWLAAMAVTVSMASCSLEEVVEQPTPQAIGFSSFVGKPTKAVTETNVTALQASGFNVWGGYADNQTLFSGRKVSYNTSKWEYEDNLEYWVADQQYYFAALGPTNAVTNAVTGSSFAYAADGGHLSFTYTQTDLTKSTDVVYAEGAKKTEVSITSDPGPVDFTFGHIMSWIKIKFVHKMTTGYEVTVSDVTVAGVKTGANYDGSTPEWTAPGTEAAFTGQAPHSYKKTGDADDDNSLLDEEGDNCLVDFIAIPQTVSSLEISFKLTVVDSAGNKLVEGKTMSSTVSSAEWASNNIYVYTANLEYGKVGIYPIQFTVSNFNWGGTDDDNILTINQN